MQVVIGNLNIQLGRLTFASNAVVTLPVSTIVVSVVVPVVVLFGSSVVLMVVIVLVFRRKYRDKALEHLNLTAEMNQLKSSSVKSTGKYGRSL